MELPAEYAYPERLAAMLITAELVRILQAESREKSMPERLVYATPNGSCTIICEPVNGRVIVAGDAFRFDATVMPERIVVAYQGDYSPEAITVLYLLDWLHECGHLPTDPAKLSAAQLATLSDMRAERQAFAA